MRERSTLTALLGPTNTGKTHRAVERMLEHESGMIGLPLRLLAREVFDRISARVGEDRVALVTGEEKRIPRRPAYWVCTVEAMPIDRTVDFLAVDEVQLAAHSQRGHVFTDRLLHARGRLETWFLGSDTVRGVLGDLVPQAEYVSHPRLSRLTFAGASRLAKIPPRSAVVAFSTEHVHELAERMKRAFGGVAVVLGALSPRTRNAQVAMFQAGEVDHLVATDAIGMGLNLALDHVAFATLRKFDGRELRDLEPAELGQIAGRAGRFRNDGTFGTIAPLDLPEGLASDIENHRFAPLRHLVWRNSDLDFTSLDALLYSLKRPPPSRRLRLVESPEDTEVLAAMGRSAEVRNRVKNGANLPLLWDVCTIPDFRKLLFEAHVAQLEAMFLQLTGPGARIDENWIAESVDRLDDVRGDLETLLGRIASIRTWTYVSYRHDWLRDAVHWQDRTRAIEDRLSDALHAALVQRFVDPGRPRRSSAPSTRTAERRLVVTSAESRESASPASPAHPFAGLAALRDAMEPAAPPAATISRHAWIESLIDAPFERFALDAQGQIEFDHVRVGQLVPGTRLVMPDVKLTGLDGLGGGAQARVLRRLVAFARDWVGRLLAPLREPSFNRLSPTAQRIVYRLDQALGTVRTAALQEAPPARLTKSDRALLRASGVVIGPAVTFVPALLSPEAVAARTTLCKTFLGRDRAPVPPDRDAPTIVATRDVDAEAYEAIGYVRAGARAVRADRFADLFAALMREGYEGVSDERLVEALSLPAAEARRTARAIAPDAPRRGGPDDVAVSKRISSVLRHRPGEVGISLDAQGWVPVRTLLDALASHGVAVSDERLRDIVAKSDKQRFALSADGMRIRASQGHSVPVALEYEPAIPPPVLFHGTAERNLASILREGLHRGQRHAVHLSGDRETARRVGGRHGKPTVLQVDTVAMCRDGFAFRRTTNGVWLIAHVPPKYLRVDLLTR